ncbi:MAG: GAF domain-containing protein, partial [Candidatus Thorarchaeota archaeon]
YIPNSIYGDKIFELRAFKVGDGLGIITSDITERIASEKELKLSRDIAQAFLMSDDEDLFDEILRIILDNTKSKYGVFGYIDENGANVVPSMSRHIWNECQVSDKKTVFPCREWGESSWPTALREKRTIVINEASKLTPKGHVTIERHISMPLIYEDEVVGLFQVANTEDVYDEKQVRTLQDIALRVAPFLYGRLQRSRAEHARDSALVQIETLNEDLESKVESRTKELKDAQEELSRKERLAALGQLSASVGHELRNPLGAIKNGIYFLKMVLDHPEPDVLETLTILDQEIENSEEIIRSLLDFTKPKEPVLQKINLNDTITAALERIEVPLNISVKTEFSSILPVLLGDSHQLERVFTNLITNAYQAMTNEGILSLVTTVEDNGDVIAIVSDTGVGISKENLAKLFQPLFTTKARGIGLGLSIVESLIEAHGGSIKVDSEEGKGTSFRVIFPSQKTGR